MKFLDSQKNSELVINLIENDEKTLVIALRGKISSSLTGSLLDTKQNMYQKFVFNNQWDRVVFDLRALTYVNSIGVAMLINLNRLLKKVPFKIVFLMNHESEVMYTMKSVGFMTVEKPLVVENYDAALRS